MIQSSRVSDKTCPLLYLQRKLEDVEATIPVNVDGDRVVNGQFDAFRSNVVAPDHLLTGLAKNVLDAVHKYLSSQDSRRHVDVYICCALRDNGLIIQKQVFNHEKKKLYSMGLSSIFRVLLVSVPVVQILTARLQESNLAVKLFQLLSMLQIWSQS